MSEDFRLPVAGDSVSARVDVPAGPPRAGFLLAHGAGTRYDHSTLELLAVALAGQGFQVLRFNFPYAERGKKLPDSERALLAAWRDVLAWARATPPWSGLRLLAGGRSMGGRMASVAAASEDLPRFDPDGLVFYAYPLHPPGRTDRLRAQHLVRIALPMLFVSGTRDSMARTDLLESVVKGVRDRADLVWLAEADHGYAVSKKFGRTREQVVQEAAEATLRWFLARAPLV